MAILRRPDRGPLPGGPGSGGHRRGRTLGAVTGISHTKHDVPGTVGVWRPGATSHQESGTDLQDYLRPLEQAHAGALHGTGVAAGFALAAAPGATTVRVGPGVAVDPTGRHVVLAVDGLAEVSEHPDTDSRLLPVLDTGIDLPTAGHGGQCTITLAWRETFDEALAEGVPAQFVERHTPWLRILDAGVPPPAQAIVLGTVAIEQGVVGAAGVGVGGRRGITAAAAGLRLTTPVAGPSGVTDADAGSLAVSADGGLSLTAPRGDLQVRADRAAFAGADGTPRLAVDAALGRLGVDVDRPSHPLHVAAVGGIRQNRLYVSGDAGWSSLSYNAHHNEANNAWVFPDPSRPAVTVEMDDAGGRGRFEVFATTAAAPTTWVRRLAIDGNTGSVQVAGSLGVGHDDRDGIAVVASNNPGTALCATSNAGTAVHAVGGKNAIVALGPSSFVGAVDVGGALTATSKQFVIDHPLDPENRTLAHASVESDERACVYSGNVTLDEGGTATVVLPPWLESLATDFRYQLTCLGGAAPVYVSREVADGAFGIAGGGAGQRVSWQLTGIRRDPWAAAHPLLVEEDKAVAERGSYRHPEVYGQPRERSGHYLRHRAAVRRNPRLARDMLDPGFGTDRAH